ncbi:MAG: pyrimidine 5'-nucleotidase [Alphaproteobacteria bacterium]|nr:pyrimidine 5'-nucleotidase [Alphaproteobacteria bacterium]
MIRRTAQDIADTEAWIFDLDNTLYPESCDLFPQVERRIRAFVGVTLSVDEPTARDLQRRYGERYGSTLRGLMSEHQVDAEGFLRYVHDIDYGSLQPNPALDRALAGLAGRKTIFTNGSVAHAREVLAHLGIARHFDDVFDIAVADYWPKPNIAPYRALLHRLAVKPSAAIMVEDMPRNLEPAAQLGMTTVWVENNHPRAVLDPGAPHVHHRVRDLAGLAGWRGSHQVGALTPGSAPVCSREQAGDWNHGRRPPTDHRRSLGKPRPDRREDDWRGS